MKRSFASICAFGIAFLFFVQMAGTLVESIYMMDLLHSKLDRNALGILFLFAPLLFVPLLRKPSAIRAWILLALLAAARGATPYLLTAARVLSSGVGAGAALCLVLLLIESERESEGGLGVGARGSAGLALAVALSAFLRSAGRGLDYSLAPAGGWVAWALALALALIVGAPRRPAERPGRPGKASAAAPAAGLVLALGLLYSAFSAPAVIARWTEGNYAIIALAVSLFAALWILLSLLAPGLLERSSPPLLGLLNLLFALALTGTLLAHRVAFPASLGAAPVIVGPPLWWQRVPLAATLLLYPVLFLDARLFLGRIRAAGPAPRGLALGLFLGILVLVACVFAQIFTNVWGYIPPISPFFRNKYWLPFLVLALSVALLALGRARAEEPAGPASHGGSRRDWIPALAALAGLSIATVLFALPTKRVEAPASGEGSFRAMTFNIQQANDVAGEKAFDRQLALIRKVSPDILALQETDSARVSLDNNDYVRYYAEGLGYYSYYGPTTVTGTYGTAILSKYPLLNTRAAFMYSDKDETGVAEAEVEIGGRRISIFDVHPDSSDQAMVGFARNLIARSKDKPYAVMMGDYNLRDYEEAYKIVDGAYANAWTALYPTKIGPDGVDMSGEDRIDHIFLSASLIPLRAFYVKPPASGTDHAVHWADIGWKSP